MKKIILLISLLVWIWVLVWGWLYITNKNKATSVTKTDVVKPVVNVNEEAEKLLLSNEIKTKLEFLNKALKPNYLKISDYKEYDNIWWYKDWVTFYKISIDYDITENSMADYDVYINKWSISEADFKNKSKLYKENLERTMKNIYYKANWYDKLVKIWIIWYIEKTWDNSYIMYELWDYIKNKFSKNTVDVNTLWKIEILKDYFNYQPIFFDKEEKQIINILKDVEKELKDAKFSELYPILNKLFFSETTTK